MTCVHLWRAGALVEGVVGLNGVRDVSVLRRNRGNASSKSEYMYAIMTRGCSSNETDKKSRILCFLIRVAPRKAANVTCKIYHRISTSASISRIRPNDTTVHQPIV
jgi:hypothetical protein